MEPGILHGSVRIGERTQLYTLTGHCSDRVGVCCLNSGVVACTYAFLWPKAQLVKSLSKVANHATMHRYDRRILIRHGRLGIYWSHSQLNPPPVLPTASRRPPLGRWGLIALRGVGQPEVRRTPVILTPRHTTSSSRNGSDIATIG